MATIDDISIIDSNTVEAAPVASGWERPLCSPSLCDAKNLTVYRRTILAGRQFDLPAGADYHVVYLIQGAADGLVHFASQAHVATEGAGVFLTPGESTRFEAVESDLELLHMVAPPPPPDVEDGLPGGPGYFFDRQTLRALTDAGGGRVRRFCAESSIERRDGRRLTPTNAIQAGEMHYQEGGSSPYHKHEATDANPEGAGHVYMTFKGRSRVEVGDTSQEIAPGTLLYFPPGTPHRLHAVGGPLDYFEIQAWRSFKTSVLSEEPMGLRWYYESDTPDAEAIEWNQT